MLVARAVLRPKQQKHRSAIISIVVGCCKVILKSVSSCMCVAVCAGKKGAVIVTVHDTDMRRLYSTLYYRRSAAECESYDE